MAKSHGKLLTAGQFHTTLRTLLNAGFLIKLGSRAYLPAADLQHEMEEVVIGEQFPDRKVSGPKKEAEFKLAVNNLKRKWRDSEDFSDYRDLAASGSIKRPGAPLNTAAKRMKMNGGEQNGIHGGHHVELEENVPRLSVLCGGIPTQSDVADNA